MYSSFFLLSLSFFLPSYKIACYYTISAFLFSPQLSSATRKENIVCCEARHVSLWADQSLEKPRDESSGVLGSLGSGEGANFGDGMSN